MCSLYSYNAYLSLPYLPTILKFMLFLFIYSSVHVCAYNAKFSRMCSLYSYNAYLSLHLLPLDCILFFIFICIFAFVHVGTYKANLSLPYLPPSDCIFILFYLCIYSLPVRKSEHTMRISVSPTCLHFRVRTIIPPSSAFCNFSSVRGGEKKKSVHCYQEPKP